MVIIWVTAKTIDKYFKIPYSHEAYEEAYNIIRSSIRADRQRLGLLSMLQPFSFWRNSNWLTQSSDIEYRVRNALKKNRLAQSKLKTPDFLNKKRYV